VSVNDNCHCAGTTDVTVKVIGYDTIEEFNVDSKAEYTA